MALLVVARDEQEMWCQTFYLRPGEELVGRAIKVAWTGYITRHPDGGVHRLFEDAEPHFPLTASVYWVHVSPVPEMERVSITQDDLDSWDKEFIGDIMQEVRT